MGIDTEADLFDDTLDIYIPEQHNKWGQVGYGFRDIVKLFNSEGIPSKKGNEWYTSTVANIIHEVEESIIDMFVERIVSHPDGSFDWYINIQEDCTKAIPVNKFAKDYSRRYELPESRYEFIEYSICFDEANDFVKSYGRRAFQYQKNDGTPIWKDIVARVYLVM